MKNIGNLVRKHGTKSIINIAYLVPVFLLLIGIVLIAVAMFKALETERTYYYVGMVILAILAIILLVGRASTLPKYYFELYEKGIKIIYKKEKKADEEYAFDEIAEIWTFSTKGEKNANGLAFLPVGGSYTVISSKFSNYKGLIKEFIGLFVNEQKSTKSNALTQGERLSFPTLPEGGENVIQSEKAVVPYLQKSKKGHLSLDRFSVFDGKTTYALADIDAAKIDSENNIVLHSVAGNILYQTSCFSVCNANLFVELVNDIAVHKTEHPQEI